MFEELRILGPSEEGITIHTRKKRAIKNDIALPPTSKHRRDYAHMQSMYGSAIPRWENRKPACGVYNCFGLLFASRRTSIREDEEIAAILADDDYRKLMKAEKIWIGDVVLYRSENNTLLHAGLIVRVEENKLAEIDGAPIARQVYVLSKWNDSFGEDIHLIDRVPYINERQYGKFTVEIWTDRN